jgi:hypothetical protein
MHSGNSHRPNLHRWENTSSEWSGGVDGDRSSRWQLQPCPIMIMDAYAFRFHGLLNQQWRAP